MASSRAARVVAAPPPPEDLPTIIPPSIPSALELLVQAYDQHAFLEWLIIEVLLRTVAKAFPHFFDVKPLHEWIGAAPLHGPLPSGCVPLATPALELKHPQLETDRTYLLIPGDAGSELYCIVVLDRERKAAIRAGKQLPTFTAFHVATLARDWLFPPAICKLVFETVYKAAMFTEADITCRVVNALHGFEEELQKIWAMRGLSW